MTIGPGIHNIPMADYVSDPCEEPSVSSAVVQSICERSPKHAMIEHPRYRTSNNRAPAPSPEMIVGSAAHAMLLGGPKVIPIGAPNWRTKIARELRSEAMAEGSIPVLASQYDKIECMIEVARKYMSRLGDWVPERTVIWRDELGPWCRSRPDVLIPERKFAIDYKTCDNASPYAWARRSLIGRCDVQAALLLRGLNSLGHKYIEVQWMIQETAPPYACSSVGMIVGSPLYEYASRKVEMGIEAWHLCQQGNVWPDYSGVQCYYPDPPAWAARMEIEAS